MTANELREVLITLTPAQFAAFSLDLAVLREDGAESNTEAIVTAVHALAVGVVDT